MNDVLIEAPENVRQAAIALIDRVSVPLYPMVKMNDTRSLVQTWLSKSEEPVPAESKGSAQGVTLGRKQHPFDKKAVAAFQTTNEHHATCIHTKVAATVGLGYIDGKPKTKTNETATPIAPGALALTKELNGEEEDTGDGHDEVSKVDEVLDPLCEHSWQDTLNDACEDFWQSGDGYLEVVRRDGDAITGLHHIPAHECFVYIENAMYERHYEIVSSEGGVGSRHFARFGEKELFISRFKAGTAIMSGGKAGNDAEHVSEVIHFRRPSSLSRWYGFPDWLPAVALVQLGQAMNQHKYDFYLNRAVPEMMLFVLGQKLPKKDWEAIETAFKSHIGTGNAHKSLCVNISNPEVKIQLEKLAMEDGGDKEFVGTKENLALGIVSAHRVPPLLAGILIPGKLGATNELPNALRAFQALVIGQAQRLFWRTLSTTLGGKMNGGLGLTPKDFIARKITEEVDLDVMDTSARMRTPEAQARAQGRDMGAGVKD